MRGILIVNKPTNWGIIPKGTEVEIIDDHTPLQQSYRARVVGEDRVFGLPKGALQSEVELKE